MGTASINQSFSLGNISFAQDADSQTVSFQHTSVYEIPLPHGYLLTAWVKTDADTAAGNLTAGHGQTTGTYDVYWEDSGSKARYGVTCTITTNAVALDGGTGDDFPATANATVVICKQVSTVSYIDGDTIQAIGIFFKNVGDTASRARWNMKDNGGNSIEAGLAYAGGVYKMLHAYNIAAIVAAGGSNAFTGNVIESTVASNSSEDSDGTLYLLVGEDAP